MTEPVRIVIADDHPVFRSGLRAMLEVEDGVEVVGEASDGIAAVSLVRAVQPDLVLMDLNMPELDGSARPGRSCTTARTCGSWC